MTISMAHTSSQPRPIQGSVLRVLVADGVSSNRELLCALVRHRGHFACEADNGRAAVEIVAAGGIDLVLMDVEMPHCNGLQVLSAALFHQVFPTQFCDPGRATSCIGPPGDAMWDGGVMRMGNEDGPGMPGRLAW